MSQFLIVVAEGKPVSSMRTLDFVLVDDAQDVFQRAAEYCGLERGKAWAVLDESGDTSDELFGTAALSLAQGDQLSSTELGVLLGEAIRAGSGLVAWYASDYAGLPEYISVIELIEYIHGDLPSGSGELYFTYGITHS